ncbi:MAG: CPBP family intramembrane glutamic endopeptidase [Conexivisphaerales archaeon]
MRAAWEGVEDALLYILVILALAVLASMLISFPIGAYVFNSPSLSGTSRTYQVSDLPMLLFGINFPIPLPHSISFETFFIILWCINLTLFVVMLMGPWHGIVSAVKRVAADKNLAIYSNSALSVGVLFPATLVFAVLLEQLLNTVGLPVGSLTNTDQRYFFLLSTFAPLREEIGFRVCFVGLTSFVLAYVAKGRGLALKALWHPSKALGEAGVQLWKQPGLIAAIILSSFAFGAAHVLYGGGWEIGKFVSASAVGLILAAIYYTHGFPAAVILHWGFDYYQSAFTYFDQLRGVVDASGNAVQGELLLSSVFYVNLLLIVAAAALYIFLLFMVVKTFLSKRTTQIAFK